MGRCGELRLMTHAEKSKPSSSIIQKAAGSGLYSGLPCVAPFLQSYLTGGGSSGLRVSDACLC